MRASSFTNAAKISAGWLLSFAVEGDGTAYAWGYNASSQLGNGTFVPARMSAPVSIPSAVFLTARESNSLSLLADGTLRS